MCTHTHDVIDNYGNIHQHIGIVACTQSIPPLEIVRGGWGGGVFVYDSLCMFVLPLYHSNRPDGLFCYYSSFRWPFMC